MPLSVEELDLKEFNNDLFGEWCQDLSLLNSKFSNARPYPHIIIDNFFNSGYAETLNQEFPGKEWDKWMSYHNPIEIKKVMDQVDEMPENIKNVFYQLNHPNFIEKIKIITGIENLEYDPHLHGGGLHFHPPGGKLYLHLDYSIHPLSGKERRINIIIYMNKNWDSKEGGNLELWSAGLRECAQVVECSFNRAVIFQTFDESWHGLPQAVTREEGRKSLAVYYVSDPRPDATLRYKAQFVQRPGDVIDEKIQKLLDIRVTRRITPEDIADIYPDWEFTFSSCSKD